MNKPQHASHNSIDPQKIANMQEDFANKNVDGCPYHKLIGHLNMITKSMNSDTLPPLKKIIAEVYARWGNLLQRVTWVIGKHIKAPMALKNQYRVTKQVYDILLLQEEVWSVIHDALITNKDHYFWAIAMQPWWLRIWDIEARKRVWTLFQTFMSEALKDALLHREAMKETVDIDFYYAQQIAADYAEMAKWLSMWFGIMFLQWAMDAFGNAWSLLLYIPELYHKKYKRYPTREEYRAITESNMRTLLPSLAWLHLSGLTNSLRSNRQVASGDVNASLDIQTATHTLDENDIVMPKKAYLTKVHKRTDGRVKDWQELQDRLPEDDVYATYIMHTWCPALKAKMPDGRQFVEHYVEDLLSFFDTFYFPHWKE